MAITPGAFDILFTSIKDALIAYSATQDAADKFEVYADFYRMFPANTDGANVYLYMGSIVPTERTTESYFGQDVTYFIDIVALAKGTKTGAVYDRADIAAGIRFRSLVQQVFSALAGSDNFNFGQPVGTVGKKEFRLDPLPPEMQMGERPIVGGRLTLTLGLCWEPSKLTGVELDSILVTADKWAALIEP